MASAIVTSCDITGEAYHGLEASRAYLGIHQYQDWLECPARTRAELAGEDSELFTRYKADKACFKVGTYMHLALGEPDKLPDWLDVNRAEVYKKNGDMYAEYEHAAAAVARAKADPTIGQILEVGESERTFTGTIGGAPWKIRVDWLAEDAGLFVDWKSAATFDDTWTSINGRTTKVPWYYGYWGQMATYREVLRQATGQELTPYIVGLRKPTPSFPPAVCAVEFGDDGHLASCLANIEANIPQVIRWKTGEDAAFACGRCWWCAAKQPLKVTRAEWYG